jgi:hypothetical protein
MRLPVEGTVEDQQSDARSAILRALERAPFDVWTRDSLARSLGLSSGLTDTILAKLVDARIVHRSDDEEPEFTIAGHLEG